MLGALRRPSGPQWGREVWDDLPAAMGSAGERSGRVSREALRIMQALMMEGRVGQKLRGPVVEERSDHPRDVGKPRSDGPRKWTVGAGPKLRGGGGGPPAPARASASGRQGVTGS